MCDVQKMKDEKEVKLVGGHNNQLKYSDCSKEDVLKKIQNLFDALKIKHRNLQRRKQTDQYYDSDRNDIYRECGSARLRTIEEEGKPKMKKATIKKRNKTENPQMPNALLRDELEWDTDSEVELIKKLREVFILPKTEKISCRFTVINERNYWDIETENAEYELSYDKYYYKDGKKESEAFYEIEIELKHRKSSDEQKVDEKIVQLSQIIENVMNFESDQKSKYERGVEWKKIEKDAGRKYFIALDIVGYSKDFSYVQKGKIEKFTEIVDKSSMGMEVIKYIPLGDGMIIVVERSDEIFCFLREVMDQITVYNKYQRDEKKIRLHMAVHAGTVMEYIDISKMPNYAGNAINRVYRIVNETKPNQLLVSDEFYQDIRDREAVDESAFCKEEALVVKHGQKMEVWNYYSRDTGLGIPAEEY